mmetsp:Transcript_51983/g.122956  ORF Transcript_51983/g.122956 Transcript_51983/m.122956 type:complete len:234 (-) Transcript_51983:362-1063(-)
MLGGRSRTYPSGLSLVTQVVSLEAELQVAEGGGPDDPGDRNEGEALVQRHEAEVDHVQRRPHREHRHRIRHKGSLVVHPRRRAHFLRSLTYRHLLSARLRRTACALYPGVCCCLEEVPHGIVNEGTGQPQIENGGFQRSHRSGDPEHLRVQLMVRPVAQPSAVVNAPEGEDSKPLQVQLVRTAGLISASFDALRDYVACQVAHAFERSTNFHRMGLHQSGPGPRKRSRHRDRF